MRSIFCSVVALALAMGCGGGAEGAGLFAGADVVHEKEAGIVEDSGPADDAGDAAPDVVHEEEAGIVEDSGPADDAGDAAPVCLAPGEICAFQEGGFSGPWQSKGACCGSLYRCCGDIFQATCVSPPGGRCDERN